MAGSVEVELADTLPFAFARLARHHGRVTAFGESGERVTWGELAGRTRLLALAFEERGMAPGDTVAVSLPEGAWRVAVDQAALAVGAILTDTDTDTDTDGTTWRVGSGGLSRRRGEVTPRPRLLAAGRTADRAHPDRFEELAAAVARRDVAISIGDHSFTHDQLLWGLRSVVSWLAPVTGDADIGTGVDVVVPGGWHDPGRALLGVWWPLTVGATVHVVGRPADPLAAVAASVASARPVVAMAEPATWAALVAAVRHPVVDSWPAGRRYLGAGRARAAGERLGPVEGLQRRVLDRMWGGRLRHDLGLDRCRWAVSLGRPDEGVRRDLAAIGVDLVVTFLADGVAGPVTATAPGGPPWSSGSPLPGRLVTVEGGEVMVGGAGVSDSPANGTRRTGRRGRLSADGQLQLVGR